MLAKQNGNILFLILLAVVLFAALAYAVTNSLNGGGKDASSEKNRAAAADILNYLAEIDVAVARMLASGVPKENISFAFPEKRNNGSAPVLNNTNCIGDDCKIFHPDGGGISVRTFTSYANPNVTACASCVIPGFIKFYALAWPYAGTAAGDIVVIVEALKPEICDAMAETLNLANRFYPTGTAVQVHNVSDWDNGTYTLTNATNHIDLISRNTVVSPNLNSGDLLHCKIAHLVMRR